MDENLKILVCQFYNIERDMSEIGTFFVHLKLSLTPLKERTVSLTPSMIEKYPWPPLRIDVWKFEIFENFKKLSFRPAQRYNAVFGDKGW